MRYRLIFGIVAMELGLCGAALAADPRFPDWPCNQIKVPEISIAAVWAGPPIDDVESTWQEDPSVADLVARLAARRTPIEEAEKEIAEFVSGSDAARQQKAKLVFAGLIQTLNQERSKVMNGIERYSRLQKGAAERIRAEAHQLADLQNSADRNEDIGELSNRIEWDTRIFDDRRRTISYVCEVPVLIEQRLFALARAIQQQLE